VKKLKEELKKHSAKVRKGRARVSKCAPWLGYLRKAESKVAKLSAQLRVHQYKVLKGKGKSKK
jgi:hypothetical protein